MRDNDALRCVYCSQAITSGDGAQRVSKRETARTVAVNDAEVESALDTQSDHNSRIEVLEIKPIPQGGNFQAFASVRLGGVTIHDCRIVQQPGQKAWVSLPQKEYTTKAGEKKFSALVELTEPLRREVSRIVLAQWKQEGRQ